MANKYRLFADQDIVGCNLRRRVRDKRAEFSRTLDPDVFRDVHHYAISCEFAIIS
jgi:hypothetical protein